MTDVKYNFYQSLSTTPSILPPLPDRTHTKRLEERIGQSADRPTIHFHNNIILFIITFIYTAQINYTVFKCRISIVMVNMKTPQSDT